MYDDTHSCRQKSSTERSSSNQIRTARRRHGEFDRWALGGRSAREVRAVHQKASDARTTTAQTRRQTQGFSAANKQNLRIAESAPEGARVFRPRNPHQVPP